MSKSAGSLVIVMALCVLGAYVDLRAGEAVYEPSWQSLETAAIPQWLKDAKFGVYTHWGVFSVPAHGGPDYIKNLYGGAVPTNVPASASSASA